MTNDRFLKSTALLLALTLLLALGTLFVLRPQAVEKSPHITTVGAELGQVSSSLHSLTIHSHTDPHSKEYVVMRTPCPGVYSLDFKTPLPPVPATSKVDALLRVLYETKLSSIEISASNAPPQDWIDFKSLAAEKRLALSTQPGPLWVATIGSPPVVYKAERDLSAILTQSSLQQLADTHLAPGLNERTSEITIESRGTLVHLVRTPSSWTLTAPIALAADRNTAETTRVLLTELPGTEILWDRDPIDKSLGVETPQAVITASMPIQESTSQTPNVFSVKIAIGADADVSGEAVFAKIAAYVTQAGSTPVYGPYIAKIEKSLLNRIPLAASEYAVRIALTLEASDVRTLAIGKGGESPAHAYALTPTGWTSQGTAIDQAKSTSLTKLLSILTQTRADFVSLTPKTAMPQHSIYIGSANTNDAIALNIGKSGEVWWIQNNVIELRYRNMNELGDLIESLSR